MRVPGIPFVPGHNDYKDRDGTKYAIAIHNTSNNASDEGEANYAKTRPDGVSSHFYCDRDSVTQSLDTNVRAGHAGSREGNENAIAVEITGGNGKSRQWWLDNVDWDELGRVLAVVCRHYNIPVVHRTVAQMKDNPKVRGFYGHDDMRRAWGGTTHTDPGPNFPWDRLLAAVQSKLNGEDDDMPYSEHELTAFPWRYHGRGMPGVPSGRSTLWVLGSIYSLCKAMAEKTGVDPAVLAQVEAAAQEGVAAAADELADAIGARLPDADRAMVVAAVREVFADAGSVDDLPDGPGAGE